MFSAPPVIIKKKQEDDAPAPAPAADEDEEIEASWADLSSDEEEETIQINSFLDIGCAPGGDKQPPSCLPLCPPLCLTPVSKPNCTVTACMLTSLPLSFSVCLCVWPWSWEGGVPWGGGLGAGRVCAVSAGHIPCSNCRPPSVLMALITWWQDSRSSCWTTRTGGEGSG